MSEPRSDFKAVFAGMWLVTPAFAISEAIAERLFGPDNTVASLAVVIPALVCAFVVLRRFRLTERLLRA